MKDTGIVRRIDELGRIVIPKEIRKTLRLKEGTQMEIYTTENGELVLKKHAVVSSLDDYATMVATSLQSTLEAGVLVCNIDNIVATCGVNKKDYINKELSTEVDNMLQSRKNYILNKNEDSTLVPIINNDKQEYTSEIIVPIIVSSDVVGAIVVVANDNEHSFSSSDVKLVHTVASMYASLLE